MAHIIARQDRPHSIIASLRGLVAGWRERVERNRLFDRTYGELSSLSDRELADIGLTRSQILDIALDTARRA